MSEKMINCGFLNFSGCLDSYSYYNALRGTFMYFLWTGVLVIIPILLIVFYILKSKTLVQEEKDKYSSWIKYTLLTLLVVLLINIILNLIFSYLSK